jgi:hypothetical protein
VLLLAVPLSGCEFFDWLKTRFQTCRDVQIDLVNLRQTGKATYLIGPDERFLAENLVEPGASRRVILCLDRGNRKKFLAGRNDDGVGDVEIIDTVNCVVSRTSSGYEGETIRVVWGPQGFTCEGW